LKDQKDQKLKEKRKLQRNPKKFLPIFPPKPDQRLDRSLEIRNLCSVSEVGLPNHPARTFMDDYGPNIARSIEKTW